MSYLLILAIEELLDFINRATMRDDRVHPVSRQIARLHVLEEARHVSFAKSYLAEVWPTLDADEREIVRDAAADAGRRRRVAQPQPRRVRSPADRRRCRDRRTNPHYRANVVAGLAKLTSFLTDLGVIDETEPWIEFGLIAGDPRPSAAEVLSDFQQTRGISTVDTNPVIDMLGRRLRLAVIGGRPGSFIGAMHRTAARLDDRYELVAGVLSSDTDR